MPRNKNVPMLEVSVCRTEEIPLGLGRAFRFAGRSLAVFRTRHNEFRTVDNTCPHRRAPLADGMIVGDSIVCPYHAFRYDLQSGECHDQAMCGITTYKTRTENGTVLISLSPETCSPTR